MQKKLQEASASQLKRINELDVACGL